MNVYLCTDAQIDSFRWDSRRLGDFTSNAQTGGDCYLADFWDGLHFLLTSGPGSHGLPWGALKVGDVEFVGAADDTHAIYSRTARALADELERFSEEKLRARLDLKKMLETGVYPGREWAFPQYEEDTLQELMSYYRRLSSVAATARAERRGLIFCRYEDW